MKLLFFPKYPPMGASSRLRTYQFLPLWKQAGYEIRVSSFFNDAYLSQVYTHQRPEFWNVLKCYLRRFSSLFSVFRYDCIWIEKELFPFIPAWVEQLLAALGVKLILDYDDAVFHNYDKSKNFWVRTFLPKKIDRVMKAANVVFAGSRYLAQRAKRAGALQVIILPTVIDPKKYTLSRYPITTSAVHSSDNSVQDGRQASESLPSIGWIGSPSTLKYLRLVTGALSSLYHKRPFRFVLINGGSVQYRQYLDLPEEAITHYVWSEQDEVSQIHQIDIGIMPLPDDPWERGKCAYKLIQYMACGLPVVASPVGMNTEVVSPGDNGYLASNEQEWVEYLGRLLADEEARESMGRKGRGLVEKQFTLERSFERMQDVVRQLIK
jgi:glycosyltransferase involved in cell wall biosynthesis